MRKLLTLLAAVMMSVVLMTPTAFAAPLVNSATEPTPNVVIPDPDVPRNELPEDPVTLPDETEIEESDVPLDELPEDPVEPPDEVEIDDPDVPLSDLPSPQTGVTGLSGMETVSLMTAALVVGGALALAKARKQTGSVR